MAATPSSGTEASERTEDAAKPTIAVCKRSRGALVFLESGNTDGWIASDVVVESTR